MRFSSGTLLELTLLKYVYFLQSHALSSTGSPLLILLVELLYPLDATPSPPLLSSLIGMYSLPEFYPVNPPVESKLNELSPLQEKYSA